MKDDITMKPLIALAVEEALRLALKDCRMPGDTRLEDIDLTALGQSLCLRLLGTGGWFVRGVYKGNATPQEILHACIERPERSNVADIVEALGLVDDTSRLREVGDLSK